MMGRFLAVYIIMTAVTIFLIIFSTRKEKKYLSKVTWERSSPLQRRVISWVIRSIFIVMTCFVLIVFIIPMSIDIPNLISGNYATSRGIISLHDKANHSHANPGSNFFDAQSFTLNNKENFRVYYGPDLAKGDEVVVTYLPFSKYVLAIDVVE